MSARKSSKGSRRMFEVGSTSAPKGPSAPTTCHALAVNRGTQKWCVLVQVLERHPPKDTRTEANRNGIRSRNYVVTDMQGTKVGVATYASNISLFENTLLPYRRYYISNAGVRNCQEEYRVGPYMFSWTLYRTTPVDPYEEDTIHRFPCTYDTVRFSDFYSHADRNDPITVTAFVVQAFPERRYREDLASRDYILVSPERLPVIFRVWNNPIEQDNIELWEIRPDPLLIVARNIRVTTYHGISLTTRYNTYILHDPPLIDEDAWRSWYDQNHPDITTMVVARVHHDPSRMFRPPLPTEIVPVETARTTIQTLKTTWIRGRLDMNPGQGKLWSTCCKFCGRNYNAGDNANVFCSNCQEWAPIQIRSHVGVQIGDESGTMDIIIGTPEIERILPFTGVDVKAADDNGHPLHDEIENILLNKEVWCFIKYFDTDVNGYTIRRHPVLKLYAEEDMIQPPPEAVPVAPLPDVMMPTVLAPSPTRATAAEANPPAVDESASTPPPTEIVTARILPNPALDKVPQTADSTPVVRRTLALDLANIKKEKGESTSAEKSITPATKDSSCTSKDRH